MLAEKTREADRKLFAAYDFIRAEVLIGTWLKLQILGEDYLRSTMKRQTFWRHRRQIIEAGVEWNGRNVRKAINNVPYILKGVEKIDGKTAGNLL
jgi:II/X family phage/plasmid replication protein